MKKVKKILQPEFYNVTCTGCGVPLKNTGKFLYQYVLFGRIFKVPFEDNGVCVSKPENITWCLN